MTRTNTRVGRAPHKPLTSRNDPTASVASVASVISAP